MAVPTVAGIGDNAGTTGALTVPMPPELQIDDILLMFVETANQDIATPAGWTELSASPQGTGSAGTADATRLLIFWKRADGLEVPIELADPGNHTMGFTYCIRGAILTGDPIEVALGDTLDVASDTVTIPSANTTAADCLVFACTTHSVDMSSSSSQFSGYANASLTDLTERSDRSTTNGFGGGIGVATGTKAVAGSYNPTTANCANSTIQAHITFAIRPEPPPAFSERRVLISFAQLQVPEP